MDKNTRTSYGDLIEVKHLKKILESIPDDALVGLSSDSFSPLVTHVTFTRSVSYFESTPRDVFCLHPSLLDEDAVDLEETMQ